MPGATEAGRSADQYSPSCYTRLRIERPLIPQQPSRSFKGRDLQIPFLVDRHRPSIQGSSLEPQGRHHHHHRRQSSGVGGLFRFSGFPGALDPGRSQRPPKCQGTKSSIPLLVPRPSVSGGERCKSLIRQPDYSRLHQSSRGLQVSESYENLTLPVQVSGTTLPPSISLISEGCGKLQGGLSQQTVPQSGGMGTMPRDISRDMQFVGHPKDRLICLANEQEGQELLTVPRRQSPGNRRSSSTMGQGPLICLSANQTLAQSDQKDTTGQGPHNPHSGLLGKKGMVSFFEENVLVRSMGATREGGYAQPGLDMSSTSAEPSSDSLALERQLLVDRGFSSD
ncbi:uncharacterized protein [Dendropsophus ebraccatus]|uniref:uncharacterized protein n=1 Tax=Dendropsophus ebraccatus TaxID=150705 RepID=UPI00383177D1